MSGIKRSNPFAQYAHGGSMPVAKRIKRLERKVAKQRPEMKIVTQSIDATVAAKTDPGGVKGFTQSIITNITQGDAINQRTGNRIRVWRIEIRGFMRGQLDGYLLQNHGANTLDESYFTGFAGAMLTDNKINSEFTEWKHFSPFNQDVAERGRFKIVQKFNGMNVKYAGSGSAAADNALHLCFLNTSNATREVTCTVRVWYTDA